MSRIDISLPLFEGMPSFPGDPRFASRPVRSIQRGEVYRLSRLGLGTHTGTHVDPPGHFVPGGAGVDRIDLEVLNGPCRVVQVDPRASSVTDEVVAGIPPGTSRVLFRTANSSRWKRSLTFFPDYVGLTVEAAKSLAQRKVRLVGVDALSVENDPSETYPVHRILLRRGILILEGLLLSEAPSGAYRLECLPLRIRDGDGSPARATLLPP